MMEFFTDDMRRNPHLAYARVRSLHPVMHEPRADLWMLFDYESVKRAMTDPETFSSVVSAPGSEPAKWLIFTDPPRHSKLRALISRAFTSRAVANLEPRIAMLSNDLLDRRLQDGELDLVGDFAIPLPLMVIAEMLGAPVGDWPVFRYWSDVILGLIFTLSGGPEAERAIEEFGSVHAEMRAYLGDLLDQRREVPRDDLLTRLLEAEVDGERLTRAEILAFFQLLLLAGHETSTNLISNAVLCLIEAPDQLARLRETPALMPQAIEEVLRYRAPVQAMFRLTRRDVHLQGKLIPAGRLVLAMIGSANHDPAHFAAPERFDIGREPNPHIAFGHGIHFCLGAPLARLEARIALTSFLERVDHFELAGEGPWEPRKAFHVHGPSRLAIRVRPSHSS